MSKKITLLTIILTVSIVLSIGCSKQVPAVVVEPNQQVTTNHVSVRGEGKVVAEPDIAYITVGVETREKTAEEAQNNNAEKIESMLTVLKDEGVSDKDMQTVNYNIRPEYKWNSNDERVLIGYQVSNNIKVTIREIDKVGKILTQLGQNGMNESYGIQFAMEDTTTLYQEALAKAVENATAKAEVLAESANMSLSDLLKLTEGGVSMPYEPVYYEAAKMMDGAARGAGIESGSLEITATVEAVYGLK